MTRHVRSLAALPLLALAVALTATAPGYGQGAVLKDIEKFIGKPVPAKDAAAFAMKHDDLEEVMGIFKTKDKGGLGFEKRVQELDKKAPTKAELAKEAKELERMAELSRIVGELASAYAPEGAAKAAQWKKFAAEMAKESQAFQKAVKTGNPAVVHKAARKLNDSCIECHKVFK
jgi:hypothetical protein